MPTEKLYDTDSHLREFTATVVSCVPDGDTFLTVLDRTAFFPEAGGQASDRGTLNGIAVTDVQIENDVITHRTAGELAVGTAVTGVLDFKRRFAFMQNHSGEHILSGTAHRMFGCENVGFCLGEDFVTLDFDRELTAEQIELLETAANEKIWKNVKFRCYYPDPALLPEIPYRCKKELTGAIRLVEIEDTDCCACCAPHVNSAAEIGVIKILETERLRGGIRLHAKCGAFALNDYREKFRNTREIGNLLSVKTNETATAVNRLSAQLSEEKLNVLNMKKRLCAALLDSAKQPLLFAADMDGKELQLLADGLRKKIGSGAVFCPKGDGFAFVLCGEPARTDELFAAFRAAFPVRGGGRNGIVQGTVAGNEEAIRNFFIQSE